MEGRKKRRNVEEMEEGRNKEREEGMEEEKEGGEKEGS